MPRKPAGYSIVELLIGLCLAAVVSVAAYRATISINLKGVQTVRSIRTNQEITKALDRISSEIINAISMNGAEATLLGSLTEPNADPSKCKAKDIATSFLGTINLTASGLVPLPGLSKDQIDVSALTILDPSVQAPSAANAPSDGLRLAYIPLDSQLMPVGAPGVPISSAGYAPIPVNAPENSTVTQFLNVGDYAIIYNPKARELFRVTAINGNQVEHTAGSFWNLPFEHRFDAGVSFIQKVSLVTYAHDPVTKDLYRDDHVKDDSFVPGQTGLTGAGRIPNWSVVARNVDSFKVLYNFLHWNLGGGNCADDPSSPTKPVTCINRAPRAAKSIATCSNEIGYPFLQNIDIQLSTTSTNGELVTIARRATPLNVTHDPGLDGNTNCASGSCATVLPAIAGGGGGGGGPQTGPTNVPVRSF